MIDEVARHLTAMRPPIRVAGLLATSGTLRAGLHQECDRANIALVVPDGTTQDTGVMPAIRALKAGSGVRQPHNRSSGRHTGSSNRAHRRSSLAAPRSPSGQGLRASPSQSSTWRWSWSAPSSNAPARPCGKRDEPDVLYAICH